MKQIFKDIISLFNPRPCLMCGYLLNRNDKLICFNCLNTLEFSNNADIVNNRLFQKLSDKVQISHAASLLLYEKSDDHNKLIYHLKYKNRYDIGVFLGELSGKVIKQSSLFNNIDCIIPVPISLKSLKVRTYNQSEAISEGISKILNIPVYTDVLIRKDYRERQTNLSYEERKINAQGIYILENSYKITDKNILLVDDVITSGSTIINSIITLQQTPNCNIFVFTLASNK